MKCIFSQEKINAEVEMSLKLAINYLNKSDCPWMHPFDQSYVSYINRFQAYSSQYNTARSTVHFENKTFSQNVDMYMYNRTVGVSS